MRAAVALSLVFIAHAGATAMYDHKPGEFLVIDGGTAQAECEVVPNDKSHVLNMQPVTEQKTKD